MYCWEWLLVWNSAADVANTARPCENACPMLQWLNLISVMVCTVTCPAKQLFKWVAANEVLAEDLKLLGVCC